VSLMPDPTFYPSPGMAMKAAPEHIAYVCLLNAGKNGKRDAMSLIDVDPGSPTSGQSVGQLDFPGNDNELHHFGWNACSACLCPQNPHLLELKLSGLARVSKFGLDERSQSSEV
jgi:selenium-binding protein 1